MFGKDRETEIPNCPRPQLDDKDELVELLHMIDFAKRNRHLHEQLYQLHARGPVWDGDVVSKSDRSELLKIGACAKVTMKGEWGYNACTYGGAYLLNIYNWLFGELNQASTDKTPPAPEERAIA